MKKQWIHTDQGWEQITSEWVSGVLWVHYRGETRAYDPGATRKLFSGHARQGSGSVVALMPGKVTKVFVAEGQQVEVGQALLVMEAMKMEYTLKAQVSGAVKEVRVKEGQQVELSQLLVKIEPQNKG